MSFKLSQSVAPVTDLKFKARKIIQYLKESGRPMLITQRGRAAVVIESVESFEKREEHYERIEGILKALRQADQGDLIDHREALKILEKF